MSDKISIILEHGLNSFSYWGTIEEALKYSDCNKVIVLDTDVDEVNFLPNQALIDHYFEHDFEVFKKWENSQRTWQDSLKIFGSIQVEDQVFVDENAIIVIN